MQELVILVKQLIVHFDKDQNKIKFLNQTSSEISNAFKQNVGSTVSEIKSQIANASSGIDKLKIGISNLPKLGASAKSFLKHPPNIYSSLEMDDALYQIKWFNKSKKISQEAVDNYIANTDDSGLKAYFKTVKEGEASFEKYTNYINIANEENKKFSISSQLASIGSTAFADGLNGIINTLASSAVNGLAGLAAAAVDGLINMAVNAIDEWIRRDEILIEQAQTLQTKYNDVKESVQQNVKTLSDLESEYDILNEKFQSGNLNTEESERYRDIVQQIADISPELVEGYDAEGRAIIRKNDALRESIRLQKEAERKALGEKVSPENLKTTLNADLAASSAKKYFGKYIDDYGKTAWGGDFGFFGYSLANIFGKSAEAVSSKGGQDSVDFAKDLLNSLGIEDIESEIKKYTTEKGFDSIALLQNYADTIVENADTVVELARGKYGNDSVAGMPFDEHASNFKNQVSKYKNAVIGAEETSEAMRGHLLEVAQYNEAYSQMSDEQAILFDSMLQRFDSRDYAELGDEEVAALTDQVNSMVEKVAGNTDAQAILDSMFNLDSSKLSVNEYSAQLNTLFGQLSNAIGENFSSEEVADFKLKLGYDEAAYQDQLQQVRDKLSDDFKGREDWLTTDALEIACTIEGDDLSWDDLITKITEAKRAARDLNQEFTELSTPLEEISSAESLFAKATEEANSQGTVSAETLNDLAALDQEYITCLEDSNGKLTLNAQKFEEVTEKKREAASKAVNAELAESVLSAALNGSNEEMDTHIAKLMAMSNEYDGISDFDGPGVFSAKETLSKFITSRKEGKEAPELIEELKSISEKQLNKVGISVDTNDAGEIISLFLGEGEKRVELTAETNLEDLEGQLTVLQEQANETPLFSVDEEAEDVIGELIAKKKELDGMESALGVGANNIPQYQKAREDIAVLIQEISQLPPEVLTTYNLQVNKDGELEYLDPETNKTVTITAESLDAGAMEYLGGILEQKAKASNPVNIPITVDDEEALLKTDEIIRQLEKIGKGTVSAITVYVQEISENTKETQKKAASGGIELSKASGSAQASGTGISGVPETGSVLVGEEAPEMYVNRRTGRWKLVGMLGAEFIHAEKGDIIFSGSQTRSLLNNGFISGRGKAFANGTDAFLNFGHGIYTSKTDWSKWSVTGSNKIGGTVYLTPKVENKDVYLADIDELYEAEQRLKHLEGQEESLNHALKMTDNLIEQVNLTRQLNENYRRQQAELHGANERRDELIKSNVEKLRQAGFQVYYDQEQNRLMIANMEHINQLIGGSQEETNSLRKEYEDLISETEKLNEANQKSSDQWLKNAEAIRKNNLEIVEMTLKGYDEFLSYADDFDLWNQMDLSKMDILKEKMEYLNQAFAQGLISVDEYTRKTREIGKDIYKEQKNALKEIVELTEDLIKQETKDRVDALNTQVEKYQEIIDLKKKALQDEADEKDYSKERDAKLKEIADLQKQISRLSLDDSREAAYERMQLEEQLAEKQRELADFQEDHAREAQIDALDEEAKRFKDAKDEEIKAEEAKIDTVGKLHEKAMERIKADGENLQQTLIDYVKEHKDAIDGEDSVRSAWKIAMEAKKEYGSIPLALEGIKTETINEANDAGIFSKVQRMKHNSNLWRGADAEERKRLSEANEKLAVEVDTLLGNRGSVKKENGTWYLHDETGKRLLYSVYHTGGVVGEDTRVKPNELFALLEKGEIVLDRPKQDAAFEAIDFAQRMREKFGADISRSTEFYSPLLPRLTDQYGKMAQEIIGMGDMVFSPSIQVDLHHQGSMTEKDAVKYGNIIANTALDSLQSTFTKNGISSKRFSALKQ